MADTAPASFAGITGLAVEAGRWPVPEAGGDVGGPAASGIRRSPRAGWLDAGEVVLAAALPAGPVLTLTSPGDLVFAGFGPGRRPADEVVAEVLAAFDDPPADAAEQLDGFVRLLVEQGLLER